MGDLSSLSHFANLVVPVRVYRMSSLHLIALDIATTKCPSHIQIYSAAATAVRIPVHTSPCLSAKHRADQTASRQTKLPGLHVNIYRTESSAVQLPRRMSIMASSQKLCMVPVQMQMNTVPIMNARHQGRNTAIMTAKPMADRRVTASRAQSWSTAAVSCKPAAVWGFSNQPILQQMDD